MRPMSLILSKLEKVKRSGKGYTARCPGHDDNHASLSVREVEDGKVLLKCHATCTLEAILKALGLEKRDLFVNQPDQPQTSNSSKYIAIYDYHDEQGKLLFQVCRTKDKQFPQRRPDGKGGWVWGLDGILKVLYRLPKILEAVKAGQLILTCEGEKDVNNLVRLSFEATCNPGGAMKWEDSFSKALQGAKIGILPDNDQPGRNHANLVASSLYGIASEIRIIELPGLPEKGDVSDWLSNGGTKEQLQRLIEQAPLWQPPIKAVEAIENVSEDDLEPIPDIKWPTLNEDALYGLAGDIVRTIGPHTESDPAAILLQYLAIYGNRIGRSAYFTVESDRHYGNIFTVMVGASAKARKGTSYGRIKKLFKDADPSFLSPPGGLVSGEGLVFHVRDIIHETIQDPKTGNSQQVCRDSGVTDKRLLVYESEFSSVLKVLKREGNTLSEILRQAWDSGDLNTLAKNSKTKATNAHISLIGHITKEELRKEINEVSYANGFGNRILWCLVKRSKYLPEGSQVPESEMNKLKIQIRKSIEFAHTVTELKRDEGARQHWQEIYKQLSEGKPGLAGAMASRAEAQVLRLSCIYALFDLSASIRIEHIKAALAVWNYCLQSCGFIFGSAIGDPIADQIRQALQEKPEGMTRTEIRDLLGRNKNIKEIIRSLTVLLEYGLVKKEIRHSKTKPYEIWISSDPI